MVESECNDCAIICNLGKAVALQMSVFKVICCRKTSEQQLPSEDTNHTGNHGTHHEFLKHRHIITDIFSPKKHEIYTFAGSSHAFADLGCGFGGHVQASATNEICKPERPKGSKRQKRHRCKVRMPLREVSWMLDK